MNVRDICEEVLGLLVDCFQELEISVPPARRVIDGDRQNWKYIERSPQQIIVQKLARYVAGLKSTDLLLRGGFLQEVGVLFRMLDEISEDISFISLGLLTASWTRYHESYAKYFWSDDDANGQVQRKNIRAFVSRALGQPDPCNADRIGRTIYKTYSDYVHARSAPIVGMISGPPAKLDVSGIADLQARIPYIEQMPSYFYRGFLSANMAAKVILSAERTTAWFNVLRNFEQAHADKLF